VGVVAPKTNKHTLGRVLSCLKNAPVTSGTLAELKGYLLTTRLSFSALTALNYHTERVREPWSEMDAFKTHSGVMTFALDPKRNFGASVECYHCNFSPRNTGTGLETPMPTF